MANSSDISRSTLKWPYFKDMDEIMQGRTRNKNSDNDELMEERVLSEVSDVALLLTVH